jgi:hypothetical protein
MLNKVLIQKANIQEQYRERARVRATSRLYYEFYCLYTIHFCVCLGKYMAAAAAAARRGRGGNSVHDEGTQSEREREFSAKRRLEAI